MSTTDRTADYLLSKFAPPQRPRRGKWLACETCKRQFYVPPSRLERRVTVRFCSMSCYVKTGDKNPFWGKNHSAPYKVKMADNPNRKYFLPGPDNPNADRFGPGFTGMSLAWWRGYLILSVGRCERCGYNNIPNILHIHHIDRHRANNTRGNLEVLCPNCHEAEHYKAKDGAYRGNPTRPNRRGNGWPKAAEIAAGQST